MRQCGPPAQEAQQAGKAKQNVQGCFKVFHVCFLWLVAAGDYDGTIILHTDQAALLQGGKQLLHLFNRDRRLLRLVLVAFYRLLVLLFTLLVLLFALGIFIDPRLKLLDFRLVCGRA